MISFRAESGRAPLGHMHLQFLDQLALTGESSANLSSQGEHVVASKGGHWIGSNLTSPIVGLSRFVKWLSRLLVEDRSKEKETAPFRVTEAQTRTI